MLRDQKSYSIQCTSNMMSEQLAGFDRGELFFHDLQQELYTLLQIPVSKYDNTTETISSSSPGQMLTKLHGIKIYS